MVFMEVTTYYFSEKKCESQSLQFNRGNETTRRRWQVAVTVANAAMVGVYMMMIFLEQSSRK